MTIKQDNLIQGWTSEEELKFLRNQAGKMTRVVEVGSYRGRSTKALLEGSKGEVIAVDHWKGSTGLKLKGDEYQEFIQNTKNFKNLKVIKKDSLAASREIEETDMVFIDAGHSKKEVKEDIYAWLPKTKKMICGHDYDLPEVKEAVDEVFCIDGVVGSVWYKKLDMKVILAGHEGSKKILAASSYLVNKYLMNKGKPRVNFDVYFLNYGDYKGKLFCGHYVKLADRQEGGATSWAKYIKNYLASLDDEYIIFALDDYLLNSPIDINLYDSIKKENYDCVNLCAASGPDNNEYITTQYTIWKRTVLIDILSKVNTPWEFELQGSMYAKSINIQQIFVPAMSYPDASALSGKWEGVRLEGNERDRKKIISLL